MSELGFFHNTEWSLTEECQAIIFGEYFDQLAGFKISLSSSEVKLYSEAFEQYNNLLIKHLLNHNPHTIFRDLREIYEENKSYSANSLLDKLQTKYINYKAKLMESIDKQDKGNYKGLIAFGEMVDENYKHAQSILLRSSTVGL